MTKCVSFIYRQKMLAGLPTLKQLDGVFFTNADRSEAGLTLIEEVEDDEEESGDACVITMPFRLLS